MMTISVNEDNDAAWVATFLSEAVLAMADSEDRDVTVMPFPPGREGFTVRFGNPCGPEFQVTVARSASSHRGER
jgi:hypothetical protein